MAVTVSAKNYTLIDNCEAVGNWDGESPAAISDFFKEGTKCLGFTVRGSGNQDTWTTGNWNLDGVKHFRLWFMTVALKELNYVQFYVSDGANTGYYNILAIADYPGGWYNIVIDLSRSVDAGVKPDMANLTTIGFRYNNSAIGKNAQNTWINHLCVCDGLIAYGDDAGDYFDFDDILAADENVANGWGIIRKIGGQYFLVGSIEFGDSTANNGTKFQAKSAVVIFEDRKVNSALYNFTVVDFGDTNATEFILGDIAGTAGIEGCVIRVADVTQTPKFNIDGGTDTDVDNFKLYGTTFLDAGTLKFPLAATNVEVLNCNFESCDEVMATTCVIKNCNFVSANDEAFILPSGNTHQLTYCNFINCPDAWRVPTAGTYTCSGCLFINNTNDIDNTSGLLVTITKTNDADPISSTGNTTIQESLDITITVKDKATDPIQNVQTAVYKTSDRTQLMNEDTDVNGIATESYVGGTPVDVEIRCRKASAGATVYENFSTLATLTGDFDLLVTLIEDPYNNP